MAFVFWVNNFLPRDSYWQWFFPLLKPYAMPGIFWIHCFLFFCLFIGFGYNPYFRLHWRIISPLRKMRVGLCCRSQAGGAGCSYCFISTLSVIDRNPCLKLSCFSHAISSWSCRVLIMGPKACMCINLCNLHSDPMRVLPQWSTKHGRKPKGRKYSSSHRPWVEKCTKLTPQCC